MGKSPSSTTQNTYPPWLMKSLQPLIGGATQHLSQFANQGWNVLNGKEAGSGGTGRMPAGLQGKPVDKYPDWLQERLK